MLCHALCHVQVQAWVEYLVLWTEFRRCGAREELVTRDVDNRGEEEHDHLCRSVGCPHEGHRGEVNAVGAQDHVSVKLDSLYVLGGNLLGSSRSLLALLLGKLSHRTGVHDGGGVLDGELGQCIGGGRADYMSPTRPRRVKIFRKMFGEIVS